MAHYIVMRADDMVFGFHAENADEAEAQVHAISSQLGISTEDLSLFVRVQEDSDD